MSHPGAAPTEPGDGGPRSVTGLPTVAELRRRLALVRERVGQAGADPAAVSVVAVTKTFSTALIARAIEAGFGDLGENRAQELVAKHAELETMAAAAGSQEPGLLPTRWHFIGGLQRNKIKTLVGIVDLWHTIDREALIDELAKRAPGAPLLIQVNTTAEPQKSGCRPEQTAGLVDRAREAGLEVQGLMTMGPTGGGDPRPAFAALRQLGDRLHLEELSMGMSGDYPLAVAEGATIIRIGSALFGPRPSQ